MKQLLESQTANISLFQTFIAELLQPQLQQRGTLPKCVREIYRKKRPPFSAMFILHNPSTDLVAVTATGEGYNVPKIRSERWPRSPTEPVNDSWMTKHFSHQLLWSEYIYYQFLLFTDHNSRYCLGDFPPKICILCVRVEINKRSFEPFLCVSRFGLAVRR